MSHLDRSGAKHLEYLKLAVDDFFGRVPPSRYPPRLVLSTERFKVHPLTTHLEIRLVHSPALVEHWRRFHLKRRLGSMIRL